MSPDGNTLYVSVRSANSVAAFRIDHGMKTLVPLGITEIGANAAYVATDRTGRTLLWASYSGGVVGSHAIGRNGAVIEIPEPNRNGSVRTCHPARCLQPVCLCAAHGTECGVSISV